MAGIVGDGEISYDCKKPMQFLSKKKFARNSDIGRTNGWPLGRQSACKKTLPVESVSFPITRPGEVPPGCQAAGEREGGS